MKKPAPRNVSFSFDEAKSVVPPLPASPILLEEFQAIRKRLDSLEELLKLSIYIPAEAQIKELARQTAMGNKGALKEYRKQKYKEFGSKRSE